MTSSPLRFYFHPMSRARMVRWMLEECEAKYESVQLEYGTTMKSAEYLAINPMGKVPAIVDGDTVVTETAAILAYLADKFPHKQLAPAVDSAERGAYYRWLFFVAGPLEAATTAQSQGWLQGQTEQLALGAGFGRFDDVVRTLEQAVTGRRYLCGAQFTAADLYLASSLFWYMKMGMIPRSAAFDAYVQPLLERPAALRANALDGALIPTS